MFACLQKLDDGKQNIFSRLSLILIDLFPILPFQAFNTVQI